MSDKTLATFRIDPDKWEAFKAIANSEGSNASAILTNFVDWYLDGNRTEAVESEAKRIDTNTDKIDERIDSKIAEIDKRIDERINEAMTDKTAYLSNSLNGILDKLYKRIEELEGKLPA